MKHEPTNPEGQKYEPKDFPRVCEVALRWLDKLPMAAIPKQFIEDFYSVKHSLGNMAKVKE